VGERLALEFIYLFLYTFIIFVVASFCNFWYNYFIAQLNVNLCSVDFYELILCIKLLEANLSSIIDLNWKTTTTNLR
jgi:hypothetical protein